MIELHSFDRRLDEYFQEVVNGDIIVFQRAYPDMVATKDEFATAVGYFRLAFIPDISIASLQVRYYSEALPTTALILCQS